jgi:transcriptional regulator with XRE-family HTH domain
MLNTELIKERMRALNLTQSDVAERLGLAQSSFNQKLNNVRPLFADEMEIMLDVLQLDESDINRYFFQRKVAKCDDNTSI